jgi:signal transduction histidine kinase
MNLIKKVLWEFNLPARAQEMGVPIWISPQFIFLVMGAIVVAVLLTTRVIALQYLDPDVSFLIILGLSIFLLVVTFVVVRAFEKVLEAKQSEAVKAKEVLALKDQFVFIAAHELRNPVNAIKWAVELIQSKSRGGALPGKDLFDVLERSADRLFELVHDLLQVARLESGAVHFSYQGYSARAVCDDIVSQHALGAKKEKKQLICHIPKDAPKIVVDQNRLKEIFDNLLGNAVKFSPSGSEVSISAEWDAQNVTISVADQGSGIAKEDAPHVFEKFWRAESSKKIEGTGLGLFIARHLVEQMGGEIWFESEPGEGTTFFVKLPRSD